MFSKDSVFIKSNSFLRHADLVLYSISAPINDCQPLKGIIFIGVLRYVPLIQFYGFSKPYSLFQPIELHAGFLAHERSFHILTVLLHSAEASARTAFDGTVVWQQSLYHQTQTPAIRRKEKDMSDYLTKDEAAKRLRISKRTLDRLVANGEILAARIGARRLVYRPEDLDKYVRGRLLEAARH